MSTSGPSEDLGTAQENNLTPNGPWTIPFSPSGHRLFQSSMRNFGWSELISNRILGVHETVRFLSFHAHWPLCSKTPNFSLICMFHEGLFQEFKSLNLSPRLSQFPWVTSLAQDVLQRQKAVSKLLARSRSLKMTLSLARFFVLLLSPNIPLCECVTPWHPPPPLGSYVLLYRCKEPGSGYYAMSVRTFSAFNAIGVFRQCIHKRGFCRHH